MNRINPSLFMLKNTSQNFNGREEIINLIFVIINKLEAIHVRFSYRPKLSTFLLREIDYTH